MLLTHIGNYVQSAGLGTKGTDLFGGHLPASPDNLITFTQPHPGEAIRAFKKTLDHVHETFTMTVRNTDPVLAYTKAWAVFLLLDNFTGELDGVLYRLIWGRGTPMDLGPDESGRIRWSCEFYAAKDPS